MLVTKYVGDKLKKLIINITAANLTFQVQIGLSNINLSIFPIQIFSNCM